MDTDEEVPYCLAPEQVTLLVHHDYGRVRVPNELPSCSSSQMFMSKDGTLSENQEERASMTANERKAEALKRNWSGEVVKVKRRKVKKSDVCTDLSAEKVTKVVKELNCEVQEEENKIVTLSLVNPNEAAYRWLDEYELPVPSTREFRARQLVYHDLWERGYYLTSGEQFGVAWLVYEGLPGEVHATYLVHFIMDDQVLSPMHIIGLLRVAVQVKKTLVFAIVSADTSSPYYVTMDWFRSLGVEDEE